MKPEDGKKKGLEDYLVEKIKESGYPLEIEVSNLLDKKYLVHNTQFYFDEERKQGRDIDVYADPLLNIELAYRDGKLAKKLAPFHLRFEIAIECKKSKTHAWLFFTRPLGVTYLRHISGQYFDSFHKEKWGLSPVMLFLIRELRRSKKLHYDKFQEIAVAYEEVKKERGEKGDDVSRRRIFKGVNQLVKFIFYEGSSAVPSDATDDFFHVTMFFPIIVFDGDMYKVNLKSGEPQLEKTMHIPIKTNYRSPYTKEVEGFLIDVVHRSYFPEFMNKLDLDFTNIIDLILQFREELARIIKETRQK
jgi:hypothetical protein